MEKLFDRYYKDELEVKFDTLLQEAHNHRKEQLMREHTPTLLIIYLCPVHEEDALSCIDETLTVAGIEYRLITQQKERYARKRCSVHIHTQRNAHGLRIACTT